MSHARHHRDVTSRRDPSAEALWNARLIRGAIGGEIRNGRVSSGLSQESAGSAVGMSHSQFGRLERGAVARPTVEQLSLACAAVGLKLVVRAYPNGEPIRDAAQIALLGRLRGLVPESARWRSEVPIPIAGDRRAWDAVIHMLDGDVAVEAETRLRDVRPSSVGSP